MKETEYIKDEIAKCEDVDDLKTQVFPLLQSQRSQWTEKLNAILKENRYSKSEFARVCGVSRVTVDKWCKGAIPKSRETFLKIGMAAGYDMDRMNQLLQRYGRYPALYSKSLEDCVCMYVIGKDYGTEAADRYHYILTKIKENIIRSDLDEVENLSTAKFDAKLSEVKDEDELEQFITDNIAMFSYAYHKFYAYVKMCIEANYKEYAANVYELAQGQGWSSSLRQCVSAIRQRKWYPTRNKIISLGLHLSMDREQIDEMLKLAYMEPLCAKNIFESVILFILEDASLKDVLNQESGSYDPDGLCLYAKEVLEGLDMPEFSSFISELTEIDDVW